MTKRIFVATEGLTDEIVADRLIRRRFPNAVVNFKKFPSRGIDTVIKLTPAIVRAAHFGIYDILVIHFDLNGTLKSLPSKSPSDSPRWKEIDSFAMTTLNNLEMLPARPHILRIAYMAPRESTEAWLAWGKNGHAGESWEGMPRQTLKEGLFGSPPIPSKQVVLSLADAILTQMDINSKWPLSLSAFIESLNRCDI